MLAKCSRKMSAASGCDLASPLTIGSVFFLLSLILPPAAKSFLMLCQVALVCVLMVLSMTRLAIRPSKSSKLFLASFLKTAVSLLYSAMTAASAQSKVKTLQTKWDVNEKLLEQVCLKALKATASLRFLLFGAVLVISFLSGFFCLAICQASSESVSLFFLGPCSPKHDKAACLILLL